MATENKTKKTQEKSTTTSASRKNTATKAVRNAEEKYIDGDTRQKTAKAPAKAPAKASAKAPSKSRKGTDKQNKKNPEKSTMRGPSESWNVTMPYVLCVVGAFLALLFVIIFIGRQMNGVGEGGVIGDFLHNLLSWLTGWASYAVPALLFIAAFRWRKITAKGRTHAALWTQFAIILILTASIFELLFGDLQLTWNDYGQALKDFSATDSLLPGGFIGGFVAIVMRIALKQVLSAIVLIATDLLLIMFFVGLTPDAIFLYMKERHEYNRERRTEYLKEVEEARKAEALAAEAERKAAAEAKKEEARLKKEEAAIERVREREEKRRAEELRRDLERAEKEKQDAERAEQERVEQEKREQERLENEQREIERLRLEQAEQERLENERLLEQERLENERLEKERREKEEKERLAAEDSATEVDPEKTDELFCDADGNYPLATDLDFDLDEESAKRPKEGDAEGEAPAENDIDDSEAAETLPGLIPEETAPEYIYPPTTLLAEGQASLDASEFIDEIEEKKKELAAVLTSFGIRFRRIDFSRGPTITRYEIQPEPGQRVKSIQNLMDDIALSLAVSGVRFEPSIPGKSAVGIEVPNETRETVTLRSLLESEAFRNEKSKLTSCLGADIAGKTVVFDVSKMPHLLIAGSTGSGKSVCINSIIMSLLYKATPDEVKLILIDPKKVEFAVYRDMPHLQIPIISEPEKAAGALVSAVSEMERRFELIERVGVRDIAGYKKVTASDPDMPKMWHIVIIIDELADLMMTASSDVETAICRLAQKARAAGIHLIIGTQRPSVDVITGTIKANIPSRIACTVASQTDSRTILDAQGAEKLCGRGDMLFAPVGISKPRRVQGSWVSDDEVDKVVKFLINQNGTAVYDEKFMENIAIEAERCMKSKAESAEAAALSDDGEDAKFREAVEVAIESGKVATSFLQRKIKVGYSRAAALIDRMEELGIVSAPDGNKPRQVLITMEEFHERFDSGDDGE